jgi:transcriptional regulator with XRE-family HTH domain
MRIEGRLETRPQADRRDGPRRELHLRLESLSGKQARANVVVLDISQTGLLLQTSMNLAAGETLQINLPHSGFRAAQVVWAGGEFVGCRFEEPINTATLSAAQLSSQPAGAVESVSRAAIEDRSAEADTFGARLRRLREQYNLSQASLARLLNVSKLSVWKWERDDSRPRRATMEALAQLFAVSERDMLLGAPARNPPAEQKSSVGLTELIEQCKTRIAAHLGTTTDKVEITVNL